MKLTNTQLQNFIGRIKLKEENMPKYREQVNNLKERLEKKIKEDDRTGLKVTKYLLAGSWKKRTIVGNYVIRSTVLEILLGSLSYLIVSFLSTMNTRVCLKLPLTMNLRGSNRLR